MASSAQSTQWHPGDSVPDRWLLALEAGTATVEETCAALARYDWPDSTPAEAGSGSGGHVDPFPAGGWVATVDAAYGDGRISDEQYRAIYMACR